VIMSTCCHGVCNWNDYVGRDYLLDAMLNTVSDTTSSTLLKFGQDEFDLLRLWSSGTVRDIDQSDATKDSNVSKESKPEDDDSDRDDVDEDVHPTSIDQSSSSMSVVKVVEALNLKCGVQGLGRACQRLIDYGRGEYLRRVIFNHIDDDPSNATSSSSIKDSNSSNDCKVDLLYYVPESITPQNALLIAYRSKSK
jgi:tRNA:m4X modification enzyme